MKYLFIIAIIGVVQTCTPKVPQTAKVPPQEIWTTALTQCAGNDILDKKKVLFLGLSNTYGPGSAWRLPQPDDFEPEWDLKDAISDSVKFGQYIKFGNPSSCNTKFSVQNQTLVPIVADVLASAVKAGVTVDINKVMSGNISFTIFREDNLNEIPFTSWVTSSQSDPYGKSLMTVSTQNTNSKLVMKTAIWVEGLKVSMIFSPKYLDSVNATANFAKKGVNVSAGVTIKRNAGDTVSISSSKGFYIIGTFVPINADGFGATGSTVQHDSVAGDNHNPSNKLLKGITINVSPSASVTKKKNL